MTRIQLPQYTTKDYLVLGVIIFPFTLALNTIIFGAAYFQSAATFSIATVLTALAFSGEFIACGFVAVDIKKRLPEERQTMLRLILMMAIFTLLNGVFLSIVFHGYESLAILQYEFNQAGFTWAWMGMSIVNIFITLIMEGINRYHSWKEQLSESEIIRKNHAQSQMLGWKSQVNPHFLFNSLNSLSCLIEVDEQKADEFLNEMCKVYRYMLQSDNEYVVLVEEEIRFTQSYVFLLQERYGERLQVQFNIPDSHLQCYVPPLTLQVIIETATIQNVMSKSAPLCIHIRAGKPEQMLVEYNEALKENFEGSLKNTVWDGLLTRYRYLCNRDVSIGKTNGVKRFELPLVSSPNLNIDALV